MKSHRILLLATILLLIYPTHAASRQEMQEPPAPIGGQGGSQKNEELLERLRKAAEQGAVFAQLRLGSMYHRGDEVPQDNSEAARWYRMAAEQGNADGQINLGLMYFQGTGITEDNLEAYFWLNLSVAGLKGQGKEEAEKLLNTVAEKMTPQQLAKSKRLGKEWRPKDRGQSGPNAFGAAAPLSTTGPTPAETATTRPMTTSAPAPA